MLDLSEKVVLFVVYGRRSHAASRNTRGFDHLSSSAFRAAFVLRFLTRHIGITKVRLHSRRHGGGAVRAIASIVLASEIRSGSMGYTASAPRPHSGDGTRSLLRREWHEPIVSSSLRLSSRSGLGSSSPRMVPATRFSSHILLLLPRMFGCIVLASTIHSRGGPGRYVDWQCRWNCTNHSRLR